MTAGQVQTNSTVTTSSRDGAPDYSKGTATDDPPTTPTITAISPNSAPVAGGNATVITGTNLAGTTAVLIGSTAEINAGTATNLELCTDVAATGCFTVTGSTTISIASMPAHAGGAVVIQVTTLGVSGTTGYTYGAPAAPTVTATAGATKAFVNWTTPTDSGSAITGYTIATYLAGVLVGTPISGVSPAATSYTTADVGGQFWIYYDVDAR